MEINLIQEIEKLSIQFPSRILKIKGYIIEKEKKDFLEIIIYKGFSSSTTHPIEFNSEKKVLNLNCLFTSFQIFKAPLSDKRSQYLKETKIYQEIFKDQFWL